MIKMATQQALEIIEAEKETFCKLSDDIWDNPETAFKEYVSAKVLIDALKDFGFTVTENICNIETAFTASYGSGAPVIGILGEYDALSGISQKANTATKESIIPGGNGHGCGHNLLGAASLASAVAVKKYLETTKQSGTIIYYGCPGEEGGSAKAFMARDKAFDNLDSAITWHPGDVNLTGLTSSLANYQISFKFNGISAHAAACPHLGRSALDALELMNIGVQFLREHIIPEARVHYSILNTGGVSPNVVQPTAEALYLIRAPKNQQVEEIYQRICKIANGAAMMTETSVEIKFIKACSNIVPNIALTEVLYKNMLEQALPEYTAQELDFAEKISSSIENRVSSLEGFFAKLSPQKRKEFSHYKEKSIYDFIIPLSYEETVMPGSSDVGDVSWVCPTAQISATTMAADTPGHSWQLVSQGKSSIAHKGMLYASKVMAATIIELFNSPEIIANAKDELTQRLENRPFVSPIPQEIIPMAIQN